MIPGHKGHYQWHQKASTNIVKRATDHFKMHLLIKYLIFPQPLGKSFAWGPCELSPHPLTHWIDGRWLHSWQLNSGSSPGLHLNIKTVFPGMWIPIIKIRWLSDHLIFIMGIWYFYIDIVPWFPRFPGGRSTFCLRMKTRSHHIIVQVMPWCLISTKASVAVKITYF